MCVRGRGTMQKNEVTYIFRKYKWFRPRPCEEYFKSFASLIRSLQKINKWTLNQKNFKSPDYNILFNMIAIFSEAFFVSISEFVDACGIPGQVLLFWQSTASMFVTCTCLSHLEFPYPMVHSWSCNNILCASRHAHSHLNFTTQNIF